MKKFFITVRSTICEIRRAYCCHIIHCSSRYEDRYSVVILVETMTADIGSCQHSLHVTFSGILVVLYPSMAFQEARGGTLESRNEWEYRKSKLLFYFPHCSRPQAVEQYIATTKDYAELKADIEENGLDPYGTATLSNVPKHGGTHHAARWHRFMTYR